jgi:hypothetical protein
VSSITTAGVLVLDAAERHARSLDREMFVSHVRSDICEAIRAVGMERLLRSRQSLGRGPS